MSRELEFRARNKETGEALTQSYSGQCFMWASECQSIIIEQFTGLFDCNDKKIFEGDIVDLGQTVNGCSKFIIKMGLYGIEAEYAEDMASPRNYEYCIKEFFAIDNVTGEGLFVIGNIHEAKL